MANVHLDAALLEKIRRLGAATIHEAQGQTGALAAGIKPIEPTATLVGPALTVDARPADNLVLHYAVTKAKPGDVLVVDAKGFLEAGAWGDILTLAAQKAGIAGLVIDGAVRDAEAIAAMGFPVFARGLCIRGTNKNQPGRVNVPIVCAGVRIAPGDLVVGDRDGVVAVPAATVEAVIAAAERRAAVEDQQRQDLNNGRTTLDFLNLHPVLDRLEMR